jgi:hypothetical protein
MVKREDRMTQPNGKQQTDCAKAMVTPVPPAYAFEKRPRESDKAFAAFSLYLSMGPERSLEAVGQKLDKSKVQMWKWSRKFDWVARVAAHSAHLARVEREATEALARGKAAEWLTRQQEQRDEEWRVRNEILELARLAIERFKEDGEKSGSLEGIARLMDLASKLGRLSSGLATAKAEVTGDGGRPMRVEFVAALKKIYGPAAAADLVVDVEVIPAPAALPAGKEGK